MHGIIVNHKKIPQIFADFSTNITNLRVTLSSSKSQSSLIIEGSNTASTKYHSVIGNFLKMYTFLSDVVPLTNTSSSQAIKIQQELS